MSKKSGLMTDLYELTMAGAYHAAGKTSDVATFELSVRRLPPNRSYLVAAGLQQACEYLLGLSFSSDDIAHLRSLPVLESVSSDFFEYLGDLHFTGDVWAVPEGTVVFAGEPLLRVTAPVIPAQMAETYLLAALTYQTLVASKASRIVQATDGRMVVEFGSRRAHGPGAGILAARAAYIAGCAGTSNVLAGKKWSIPVYGTAAHSWTMSFESEGESFRRFLDVFGDKSILLVDTYDSVEATRTAVRLGVRFRGVRLDSGDLLDESAAVRKVLDEAGYNDALIFASGDLDEHRISDLLAAGARLDAFGVGTDLVTSRDAPALSTVYKLVEMESGGRVLRPAKLSAGKITYPGRKQVFRFSRDGEFTRDVVGLETENHASAERLLVRAIENGKLVRPLPSLQEARDRAAEQLRRLPPAVRALREPARYAVEISPELQATFERSRLSRAIK